MATKYTRHYNTKVTPQSAPIPGKKMEKNSAGGYTFAVDDWTRLERFLILGADGGTYYASEQKLTQENATCVKRCMDSDGVRTVDIITEVSTSGRAPKNDPALFALAMCAGMGQHETRKAALSKLSEVARIGTHLFTFLEYCKAFRGWGRGLRDTVAKWYNEKYPDQLAYQLVKYQRREGWSHLDALRLSHPVPSSDAHSFLYGWVKNWIKEGDMVFKSNEIEVPKVLYGFVEAKLTSKKNELINLITNCGLTHEMIPNEWKDKPEVWEALLQTMPITAMIRNLGKMTSVGLLKPMSEASKLVCQRLKDVDRLIKGRVHPITILVAQKTYADGHGFKGGLTWKAVPQIIDALDNAFYTAFKVVQPSNKRTLLALDVSSSMTCSTIAGTPLKPRQACAAMALVTMNVEPDWGAMAFSHTFQPLNISPKMRLDTVMQTMDRIGFGGTDCSLPMVYAKNEGIDVDTFIVYTDNETWAGRIHPYQALRGYRDKTGIPAKLIVVGMTATKFSIADPTDAGMLDVVGFSTDTPQVMSDFAKG